MQAIRAQIGNEIAFIARMVTDAHKTDSNGNYVVAVDEREFISNASFLRMQMALETFLEKSFVHYLMGGASTVGTTATTFAAPPNDEHAMSMVIGTQRFADWSRPDIVLKLARLYFANGGPFDSALTAITSDMSDMKTIRNGTAHVSTSTTASLSALYARKTGNQPKPVTAYEVMMSIDQSTNQALISSYQVVVLATADLIANW
jgi:hypothetical protein